MTTTTNAFDNKVHFKTMLAATIVPSTLRLKTTVKNNEQCTVLEGANKDGEMVSFWIAKKLNIKTVAELVPLMPELQAGVNAETLSKGFKYAVFMPGTMEKEDASALLS